MRRVYICHPYRNDPASNVEKVRKIVVDIGLENIEKMKTFDEDASRARKLMYDPDTPYPELFCPVSPMLAFPDEMNEPYGVEGKHGMAFCKALLIGCDELWVCSKNITDGMAEEISLAARYSIKIVWWKC